MSGAASIRLGTRRSALAMAQSQQVADALAEASGRSVELVPITSEGDVSRASLSQLGGRGVFATRLREALLAGECDVLVHSLKDLPTSEAPGLTIAAVPARVDARDVVVTRDGTPLAAITGRVGTGSPRRIAQVRRRNPRVEIVDLRGNVDSRLGRVREGELDAVILAAAGLDRLGAPPEGLHVEPVGLAEWPTAPGQGALAVEVRTADLTEPLGVAVAQLDDPDTRIAVTAERAVLAALDAGCSAPVGVHADLAGGGLRVRAIVYALDGLRRIGEDLTFSFAAGGLSTDDGDQPASSGGGYALVSSSGNGADAADGADPITRAMRAGDDVARRLLDHGAADLVPRESTP